MRVAGTSFANNSSADRPNTAASLSIVLARMSFDLDSIR